ncbi:S41 family peptidase [Marinicrinis lubricantis]|uniref:S41 family peptidase n=1 Tax=Marinicrinis lubricantis TaxID=2086470 RepID=A0ABW1IT71_9BACL
MKWNGRTLAVLVVVAMLAGSMLTLLVPNVMDAWESSVLGSGNDSAADAGNEDDAVWKQNGMTEQQIQKIATTYRLIQDKFYQKTDGEEIIDGAIDGMLQSLDDPYSVYMDAEQAKQFNESVIESQFSGVGAEVTLEQGKVTIVAPIKDSPADKAGLLPKDVILSVNGESLEGLTLNEAVAKIRGPKGTEAKLEVIRQGKSEPMEFVIVRDDIDVETVHSEMLEGNIGYMDITQFAMNTADSFHEQLEALEKQDMKGLVVDLRNNPGGILPIVIDLVEPFIPEGKIIVQVEDGNGVRQKEVSEAKGKSYPIVVLVNEGSASASEIMAAAMQESAGITVIGQPTFGKGLVQSTFDSGGEDGSNLKITIAKWLTPEGNNVNKKGVQPDIVVDLPEYALATVLPKDTTMQRDDNSSDIRSLQLMLEGLGFKPDRHDGYFSEQTELAVKAFQKVHNISMTGIVDEATATAIEEAFVSKLRDKKSDVQLQRALTELTKLIE